MRILIVDDKQAIIENLSELLASRGYQVDTACNGLDASEKCQDGRYDLLIVDHLMPIMNGIQLVKNLRQTDYYALIPIIFMTTQGTNSVQLENEAGLFSEIIDKPINESDLLNSIANYQSSNTRTLSL